MMVVCSNTRLYSLLGCLETPRIFIVSQHMTPPLLPHFHLSPCLPHPSSLPIYVPPHTYGTESYYVVPVWPGILCLLIRLIWKFKYLSASALGLLELKVCATIPDRILVLKPLKIMEICF